MDSKTICLDESIVRFLCNVYFPTGENDYQKASFRAYRDLCRTIKFKVNYKGDKNKTEKDNLKKAVAELVEKFVENIKVDPNTFDEDDGNDNIVNSHEKLCRMIVDKYSEVTESETFTYGHAQKWVNMTLKYLYILSKCKNENTYDSIVSYFHIPIDNIILDMCASPDKHNANLPEMQQLPEGFIVERKGKERDTWSSWKYSTYINYQNKLKKEIERYETKKSPIIWEIENWTPIKK